MIQIDNDVAVQISQLYGAATRLWFSVASQEMLSRGHPGVEGPKGEDDPGWSVEKAEIRGALRSLREICEALQVSDYDMAIAQAATEFLTAKQNHELLRNEKTLEYLRFHFNRLGWMVDARRNGWDPTSFTPECIA